MMAHIFSCCQKKYAQSLMEANTFKEPEVQALDLARLWYNIYITLLFLILILIINILL